MPMLYTPVHIPAPEKLFSNTNTYLSMGSCFANTIGKKLQHYKFNVEVNPFGVIFNPVSLFQLLQQSLEDNFPIEEEAYFGTINDIHFNHLVHSDLSALSKNELVENIRHSLSTTKTQLQQADTIILTLGTAIVYGLKNNGHTVANCHKVPSSHFEKKFLSTKDILEAFEKLHPLLKGKKIILSVSPVRHAKEGLIENSTSKAILKYACHILAEQNPAIHYFPAYEILIDELRDYRYYADDMLHPSSQAQEIIWEKFYTNMLDMGTQTEIKKLDALLKMAEHKPFFEHSKAHKKFLQKTLQKFKQFDGKANLSHEIDILERRLNKLD